MPFYLMTLILLRSLLLVNFRVASTHFKHCALHCLRHHACACAGIHSRESPSLCATNQILPGHVAYYSKTAGVLPVCMFSCDVFNSVRGKMQRSNWLCTVAVVVLVFACAAWEARAAVISIDFGGEWIKVALVKVRFMLGSTGIYL